MIDQRKLLGSLGGLVWLVLAAASLPAQEPPLELERTIALPDVKGRVDHVTLDATGSRLWLAALESNRLEVIDLAAGKQLQSLTGPKEPQGVCLLPESNRIIVASGADGMVRAYDEALQVVASLSGLPDADNVRYDGAQKRIYVAYGDGALAILDPEKLTKLADIRLEGHPESFQLEEHGQRIFANVPTKSHVAVIDRDRQAVVAKWPLTAAQANYPMALDEAHARLFVACRNKARLIVLDTKSGAAVADVECCGDADDVFYDPALRRIYVTGGEGFISTFQQTDADHYQPLPRVATRSGARTSLFDPKSGRLFVAVPRHGLSAAEVRVFRVRPQ
jgi:DNA-binding beta-propeller fold protein YncE